MSSIDLARTSGPLDWDRACARVPKGWYWLGAAALSGLLWFGLVDMLLIAAA